MYSINLINKMKSHTTNIFKITCLPSGKCLTRVYAGGIIFLSLNSYFQNQKSYLFTNNFFSLIKIKKKKIEH